MVLMMASFLSCSKSSVSLWSVPAPKAFDRLFQDSWHRLALDMEPPQWNLIDEVTFDNGDTAGLAGFDLHLCSFNVPLVPNYYLACSLMMKCLHLPNLQFKLVLVMVRIFSDEPFFSPHSF